MTLYRLRLVCNNCSDPLIPLDQRLGLDDYLSPRLFKLACLAVASWSFDQAQEHLKQFLQVSLSDEYLRRLSGKLVPELEKFHEISKHSQEKFAAAQGDLEFEADGVTVYTTERPREMKIGIFAVRERGEEATSEQWASRNLPKPSVRFAVAQIAESTEFVKHWTDATERLGLEHKVSGLTVLADGADWIWNRAKEAFPNGKGVLDIFHASQKIAETTNALFGEGERSRNEHERCRGLLLSDGYAGLQDWAGSLTTQEDFNDPNGALGGMLNYFASHRDHLNYASRLKRGQSIGSGMVEGAAKNMIGKRLKANNARWCENNVNKMAVICSTFYSECWEAFWQQRKRLNNT